MMSGQPPVVPQSSFEFGDVNVSDVNGEVTYIIYIQNHELLEEVLVPGTNVVLMEVLNLRLIEEIIQYVFIHVALRN